MAKPSIFSKNYDNFRRKRKRKIITTIIVVIIAVVALYFTFTNKNLKILKQKNSVVQNNNNNNNKNISNKNVKNENKKEKQKKEDSKEKSDLVNIDDNLKIKVFYDEKDNKKIYKNVCNSISNDKIYFDINPSKSSIVILEPNTQKMYLVDQNEKVADISKDKYISSKGLVILRKNKIQSNKNYIWCTSPKFIDDNNIAFISQLPWLSGNNNKFIWYGNVQNKEYNHIRDKKGENVELQNLSDKGLLVIINNEQYYLNVQGQLLK